MVRSRDADAFACGKEGHDESGAPPCLATARRSLDKQIAVIEVRHELRLRIAIVRLNTAAVIPREPRRRSAKEVLKRLVASRLPSSLAGFSSR